MLTCTGYDQITDPGQAVKGFHLCTHFLTKSSYLRDSPGDQCCLSVISISKTVCSTCCQCDHIFQCSAKFYPKDIRRCIHTEYRAHKNTLKVFRSFLCMCADHTGCRKSAPYFFRMAWTGKYSYISLRDLFFDHLTEGFQCLFLDAFCNIDDLLILADKRCHFVCSTPDIRGGYCQNCYIHILKRTLHISQDIDLIRKPYPRKPVRIFSFFPEFPGILRSR